MSFNIGAGGRLFMGTGAVPVLPFTTGVPTTLQIAAYDVSSYLDNFNISTKQGAVDVTKMTVDLNGFFKTHVAGLNDADGQSKYGDDEFGTFERRVDAVQQGTLHPRGRGKVDVVIRPRGSASGYIQYRCTVSFTQIGGDTALEAEVGGPITFKIDGQLIKETQA